MPFIYLQRAFIHGTSVTYFSLIESLPKASTNLGRYGHRSTSLSSDL